MSGPIEVAWLEYAALQRHRPFPAFNPVDERSAFYEGVIAALFALEHAAKEDLAKEVHDWAIKEAAALKYPGPMPNN